MASFVHVPLENHNPWYRTVAHVLAQLEDAGRDAFLAVLDEAALTN